MDRRRASGRAENGIGVLVVGWGHSALEQLWNPIDERSVNTFSHVVHPKYTPDEWPASCDQENVFFVFESKQQALPTPDLKLLASLEQPGVPTINNMIMSDRVVSKLGYTDGLMYATFLARRLADLFSEIKPSVVIGGYDGVHSGIALATARTMNIPWFAMNFSVIPTGLACFCDQMNPASSVILNTPDLSAKTALAGQTLHDFQNKEVSAPVHIPASPPGLWKKITQLPLRLRATYRTIQKSRQREFLRFTEYRSGHSVSAALVLLWRAAQARRALSNVQVLSQPPTSPFAFFGLHMQPESSIDTWAPFYSDQFWVVELLSRSLPPTHRLMVKIHKSDVSNYSRDQLARMKALPGVELVEPNANARSFIEQADLVVAIQGTIGLEAALLGKPVIMLGDSPFVGFPSVSRIGKIHDLPELIKSKLVEAAPERHEIVKAYSSYLAPYLPATHNDWTKTPDADDIDKFAALFDELRRYVTDTASSSPDL